MNKLRIAVLLLMTTSGCVAGAETTFRFAFGSEKPPAGYVEVSPSLSYTSERGYGFESGAAVTSTNCGGADALHSGFCTSDRPFRFSVALPEGNYNVSVLLGDCVEGSTNTVKAESRRLMLEDVRTAAGQWETRTFTVNVRTPQIPGGRSVRLKPREQGSLDWDDKLTLEFGGSRPAVCAVEIAPATNAITVYLLGDSTVTDQPEPPWNSWGQMLTRFFKPGVAIANHAESGESLKSSLGARRVEKVLSQVKPGDYVFVQFGHNDQKDKAADAVERYKANLEKLVADVRARGGTPVLVTSMERMAGVEHDTLGEYPATMRAVAREQKVDLIDLNKMSRELYLALDYGTTGPRTTGPRTVSSRLKAAFQDGTHHNAYGSYELAKCIVTGIRRDGLGLARFIVEDVPAFDPGHPDPVCYPGDEAPGGEAVSGTGG